MLLPFLELICNTEQAVDELIDVVGKTAIEAVLLLEEYLHLILEDQCLLRIVIHR